MLLLVLIKFAMIQPDLKLDMTVTLGNVLTIVAFGMAAIAFGFRIEGKVALHDSILKELRLWVQGHAECSRNQTEILGELKAAIAYLRGRNGFHEHSRSDD